MLNSSTSKWTIVLAVGTVIALTSAESQAGWFCPSTWGGSSPALASTATTYAPPYTAQMPSFMPTASTASYAPFVAQPAYSTPEVRYRWTYSRIPKTTYEPVAACDPYSGTQTTTYRPVQSKSLLPWLHREPYVVNQPVSYNPGATTACAPCGVNSCDPCGTGSGGAFGAPLGSSCASDDCVTGSTTMATPADPGYPPVHSTYEPDPADQPPAMEAPSPQPGTDLRLKPTTEPAGNPASLKSPSLISPGGRTVARPVRTVTHFQLIHLATPADEPESEPLDVSGWRASRD